jgi:hypothetical protein
LVALCPRVRSSGRIVSPFGFDFLGIPRYGKSNGKIFAINSFSVYSVDYLCSVGGFDEHYWLDGLDFCIYAEISSGRFDVLVLDVTVDHDLSLLSGDVKKWRMINIEKYEACFLLEYCGPIHVLSGVARLLVRAVLFRRYGLNWDSSFPSALAIFSGAFDGLRRRLSKLCCGRLSG